MENNYYIIKNKGGNPTHWVRSTEHGGTIGFANDIPVKVFNKDRTLFTGTKLTRYTYLYTDKSDYELSDVKVINTEVFKEPIQWKKKQKQ